MSKKIPLHKRIVHLFRGCNSFKVYIKVDHYEDISHPDVVEPSTTAVWKCPICNNMGKSDLYGWGYITLKELNNEVELLENQPKCSAPVLAFSREQEK